MSLIAIDDEVSFDVITRALGIDYLATDREGYWDGNGYSLVLCESFEKIPAEAQIAFAVFDEGYRGKRFKTPLDALVVFLDRLNEQREGAQ